MLQIDILTIFPKMFESPFSETIIRRAADAGLVKINAYDLRRWTTDNHKTVDDTPYGGGAGMVMKIEPIYKALKDIDPEKKAYRILLAAGGNTYKQEKAKQLAKKDRLVLICGRYEGVDQRVADYLVDESISIGNYVLSGGEIPAMVIVDSVVRLIGGVLGNEISLEEESFNKPNLLEYPHYTKPEIFKTNDGVELKVPQVLLSGNHKKIKEWRIKNSKFS